MKLLIVKIYKSNGGMEIQKFQITEKEYQADNMQVIYFKYVKPWFDKFPKGTILNWEWGWGNY